jgi:hypothetical protein
LDSQHDDDDDEDGQHWSHDDESEQQHDEDDKSQQYDELSDPQHFDFLQFWLNNTTDAITNARITKIQIPKNHS